MQSDDQAYLDQIEQNIRSKDNEQEDAKREAEQRAREMERIRKASSTQVPGSKSPTPPQPSKPHELENDPRYKEYFERLKKQKGGTPAAGNQSIATSAPAAGGNATPAKGNAQSISPGAIVRFDDGSIGIYKDAVSGRDYALFYFLQPDGQFAPEGVFLQSYQAKVIGNLPENYFSTLRDSSVWERDLILFHLSSFEHVGFLNNLAEHEERKPKQSAKPKHGSGSAENSTPAAGQPTAVDTKPRSDGNEKQEISQSQVPSQSGSNENSKTASQPESKPPSASPGTESEGLVKGRKFQIKFGGKQWEAVYWSDDPDGSIVAHSTHGHWSLMRLDLGRFKESLNIDGIVDGATIESIAKDVAAGK